MIRIYKYGDVDESRIFARNTPCDDVSGIVADIMKDVASNGDEALKKYELEFDKVQLSEFEVSQEEIEAACDIVGEKLIGILKTAAENIRNFHLAQKRADYVVNGRKGTVLGQKFTPIEKVALYIPGGTASYPSTVLMNAIPAKIAGCPCVFIATPPGKDGKINPAVLAAAAVAEVDKVYKIGGAQAIAALAYGTQSVPKVDKIVGPGNAFVAEAKRQVFGKVSIDMIAGPSEILIIADGNSNPHVVASDMLSQAEHDRNASAVLVTDSMSLAEKVKEELDFQLKALSRESIASDSIDRNGKVIVCDSLMQAVEVSNRIAPEHLEICTDNPFDYLPLIKNAGSVFLGRNCPEVLGDYMAGTNHTLPTGGTARFSSPLSVDDFVKKTQFIYYSSEALESVSDDIAYFAGVEGLDAHAKSAKVRFEK